MKLVLTPIFCCVLFALPMRANAQSGGQILLSKKLSGPITASSLELTLTPNVECDQTQGVLPDGSKLLSQNFSLSVDANGLGTFQGSALLLSPDGLYVLQGQLRGTVGLSPRCGASGGCRLPGHLEGMFETQPSSFERFITRSTDQKAAVTILNFSADLNQQSASPVPLYQGRLDGLVPALPASANKVSITPDKAEYKVDETVTGIITNGSDQLIQAVGFQTYCSMIQLQMQNGNHWDDVAICRLTTGAFPPLLEAGQQVRAALIPLSGQPSPAAGTYRLAFAFHFVTGAIPVGDSFTVFSQPFSITSPPSNNVTVKPERDVYQSREPVIVKITNATEQTIVTLDHKSYCSIIEVQQQQANNWVTFAPCLLNTPTRLVKIGTREEVQMKFPADDLAVKLDPGTYRMEFIYWAADANGQPTGNPFTIRSQTFSVLAKE